MSKITSATATLSNGLQMPKLGLGTYQMTLDEVRAAMPAAIDHGYRLIDTATVYKNEEAVGETLKKLIDNKVISRKDVFLESKLAPSDQGYDTAIKAVELSLQKLCTDHVDLYIVHWPGARGLDPSDQKNAALRRESWRALEELYKAGKCRAIGVSNYTERHLEEMKTYAEILPMINQIEIHPLWIPTNTIDWCRANNVAVQAYSSLARGKLLDPSAHSRHPILLQAATTHGKTVSQVLLRWAWQQNFLIIPKSVSPERIVENSNLDFELTDEEMRLIDEIHVNEPSKTCWNPENVV